MFWLLCILLFLTPLGWIGIICLGASVGYILEMKDGGRERLITELKGRTECHTADQVVGFINEL